MNISGITAIRDRVNIFGKLYTGAPLKFIINVNLGSVYTLFLIMKVFIYFFRHFFTNSVNLHQIDHICGFNLFYRTEEIQ